MSTELERERESRDYNKTISLTELLQATKF